MNDRATVPIHWSQIVGNVVPAFIVIGIALSYLLHGLSLEKTELSKSEIDTTVSEATKDVRIRLKNLEEYNSRLEARLRIAQTQSSELDVKRRTTPSLVITPRIIQSPSLNDVRDVMLEVKLTNKGETELQIENVRATAMLGSTTPDVQELISQTEELSQLRDRLYVNGQPRDSADDLLLKDAERFHRERCPHGRLFYIGEGSHHVEWKRLSDVESERVVSLLLRPGESASHAFNYLVTDSKFSHHHWFLFQITINDKVATQRKVEFVLPASRIFDSASIQQTSFSNRVTTNLYHTWEPSSPLIQMLSSAK